MKTEIMIAALGVICIGALAAVFVLWAKVDELKKIAADEHANYLAALNLHNAAAKELDAKCVELEELEELNYCCNRKLQFWLETNEKVLAEKDVLQDHLSALQKELKQEKAYFEACRNGNKALQDRLSAILCPHNDHVWKDGVCVKCGRMQDG